MHDPLIFADSNAFEKMLNSRNEIDSGEKEGNYASAAGGWKMLL